MGEIKMFSRGKTREIKFRAKSLEGQLVYFGLYDIGPAYEDDNTFYACGVPCQMGTEQQYTGSKDKKRTGEYPEGQEIYEGDILDGGLGRQGVVRWQELTAIWLVDWKFVPRDKRLKPEYYAKQLHQDILVSEVISNIWENPERYFCTVVDIYS